MNIFKVVVEWYNSNAPLTVMYYDSEGAAQRTANIYAEMETLVKSVQIFGGEVKWSLRNA